jgi:acetylornithine deacetylase/succinyl-diaminopimelate desuccinylase-like protein
MSDLSQVKKYVDANREANIELMADLIRQPSVSSTGEGVRECAVLLQKMLTDAGMKAQVLETKGLPAVYAERLVPGKPTLLFYGHYDTQPVGDLELWKTPPFEPTIIDNRMYGRGTGDNKGQLLTHIIAVDAFLKTIGSIPCGVKFLLDGEEESGSPNLAALVEENKDLFACDAVYFSDGPIHYTGRPLAVFGCRGILDLEIHLQENLRDCHSGHFGGILPNPAWNLVNVLSTMCDSDGNCLVEGFYDKVKPMTEAEKEILANIPFDVSKYVEGVGRPGAKTRDREEALYRLMFRPTMTITGLYSGHIGEGMRTIIPFEAGCKIAMRLVADQDPDEIFELVANHVKERLPHATIKKGGKMYPSRTSVELPVSKAIIAATREAWGAEPVVMPSSGASCPDYVFTKILGVPSVMVPYANVDESNHAPNENFDLDFFIRGIKTTIHVMQAFGDLASEAKK